MDNFNVNLWFAKDKEGKIVTINEVDKDTKNLYYCPLCGSEVIPRQGEINSWCFAHIDKSKCDGESMVHFWIKNKLIQKGDKFIIESDIQRNYVCKDVLIEQSYIIKGKQYRPDLTIVTECGKTIYFEMEYSNKKKLEDYIDIWSSLGNIVVEVDTRLLINSEGNKLLIFKALWYDGKCFNIKNAEDNIYHETIGKYKEQNHNSELAQKRIKDIEGLDWLWKDIRKYKIGEVDIKHISELIQSIEEFESRRIVEHILKKSNCQQIIKDYVEFNKNNNLSHIKQIIESIKMQEFIKDIVPITEIPRLIYDRLYDFPRCFFMTYKDRSISVDCNINKDTLDKEIKKELKKEIKQVENLIKEEKNTEICNLLINNEDLTYVFKGLKGKYCDWDIFESKYETSSWKKRYPTIRIGKTENQVFEIDLSRDGVLYSNDREILRNFIEDKIIENISIEIKINDITRVCCVLDIIKNRYENTYDKHKIIYKIKCDNEIQIHFIYNGRATGTDHYIILNNKLIWEHWYKHKTETWDLKNTDDGKTDYYSLMELLSNKMSSRLREEIYGYKL